MTCLCCDHRDAGHRYACDHCLARIRRQLRALADYAVIIAATTEPVRGPRTGSTGGAYGSKPPVRLDALVALDPRSRTGAGAEWDPHVDDPEPQRSLTGGVHGIACWIREEHDQRQPARWTMDSEVLYLLGQVDSASYSQWIAELAADIRELHTQARAIAHDQPPRPLGACLNDDCEGLVHDGDPPRCRACRRPYTGLDLVRLNAHQEAS